MENIENKIMSEQNQEIGKPEVVCLYCGFGQKQSVDDPFSHCDSCGYTVFGERTSGTLVKPEGWVSPRSVKPHDPLIAHERKYHHQHTH